MNFNPFPHIKNVALRERMALNALDGIIVSARSSKEALLGFDAFKDCLVTPEGRAEFLIYAARRFAWDGTVTSSSASKKQCLALLHACDALGWRASHALVRKIKRHVEYRDAWDLVIGEGGSDRSWMNKLEQDGATRALWDDYMRLFLRVLPPSRSELRCAVKKTIECLNFPVLDVITRVVGETSLPKITPLEFQTCLKKGLLEEIPFFMKKNVHALGVGERIIQIARITTLSLPSSFFNDLHVKLERKNDLDLRMHKEEYGPYLTDLLAAGMRTQTAALLETAIPKEREQASSRRRVRL